MTPRFPMLKARDIVRALKRLGFHEVRQRGSHIFLKHPRGKFTIVPSHGGEDIGRGLLRQILNEAGVSPEEFFKSL